MSFDLGPALLFCPADRPERFLKAAERADAIILDLEDAVLPDAKDAARRNVIEADLDPGRVVVRVNAVDSDAFTADLAMLAKTDFRTVMVAKTESAESLSAFDDRYSLIALCETARGVHAADRIAAHPRVTAMMWGAEDLVASSVARRPGMPMGAIATSPAMPARASSSRLGPGAKPPSMPCTSLSTTPRASIARRAMPPRRAFARRRASIPTRWRRSGPPTDPTRRPWHGRVRSSSPQRQSAVYSGSRDG